MKANINTKKKSSTRKKLIPAAGSLLISAAMLSTSTYAWFTMSREVEVTGIKMTASVPENLEISLGEGTVDSTKTQLTELNTATNATKIKAPSNTGSTDDLDWTNSVDVSSYYDFGYLVPASSVNGTDLWYTEDANDAGRSVDINASFAQADTGTPTKMTSFDVITKDTHAANYAEGVTKGYYIDIPVWFRTSSTNDINLGVVATITTGRNDTNGNENGAVTGEGDLYKAARVAILDADGAVNSVSAGANKVIYGNGIYTSDNIANAYYNRYNAAQCGGTAVATPQAVKAAVALNGVPTTGTTIGSDITNANSVYGQATFLTQATQNDSTKEWTGDAVVTVTGSDTANYGASVEKTIRVWLEGEDKNCWNPNANQSFTIDLRFVRLGTVPGVTDANNAPQQGGQGG